MHKKGFYEQYVKRPQDLVLSSVAAIALSPVMALTAGIIKAKLGSPILFRQQRPGLDGKPFTLYKFRTMGDETDSTGNYLPDEQRLGKLGATLRSLSIDELPSLFNVIRGDLSIVGPRPLLMQYLPRYNERQMMRHEVRPGLTGYAQVHGRNAISWEEKFNYDVEYVKHITFLGDWQIILQTIFVVLKREGISSAGSATMEEFLGNAEIERGQSR